MIIIKLEGGHSNQLFQYAAGRRLADKLGVELFMDKHWFSTVEDIDTPRFYELGWYDLPQRFIDHKNFALVENKPEDVKAKFYKLTKGRSKPRIRHIRQKGVGFNEEVLNLSDNVYLDGWWQDERYFRDVRPMILKDFEVKSAPSKEDVWLIKKIDGSNSVSIHFRREDYVTNAHANQFHGLPTIKYYKAALELLAKKTGQKDLELYIFSNDIEWCKQNLKFKYPMTFIGGEAKDRGPVDMRLMKYCKHNIMANSSFSWWGAWLNQNPDKIIVAPKVWFQDKKANAETEIIPSDWIRL